MYYGASGSCWKLCALQNTVGVAADSAALPYHPHICCGDSDQCCRRVVVPRRLCEQPERVGGCRNAEITWKSQSVEIDELAPQLPTVMIYPTGGNSFGHLQFLRLSGFTIIGEFPGCVPLQAEVVPEAEALLVGSPPGA